MIFFWLFFCFIFAWDVCSQNPKKQCKDKLSFSFQKCNTIVPNFRFRLLWGKFVRNQFWMKLIYLVFVLSVYSNGNGLLMSGPSSIASDQALPPELPPLPLLPPLLAMPPPQLTAMPPHLLSSVQRPGNFSLHQLNLVWCRSRFASQPPKPRF